MCQKNGLLFLFDLRRPLILWDGYVRSCVIPFYLFPSLSSSSWTFLPFPVLSSPLMDGRTDEMWFYVLGYVHNYLTHVKLLEYATWRWTSNKRTEYTRKSNTSSGNSRLHSTLLQRTAGYIQHSLRKHQVTFNTTLGNSRFHLTLPQRTAQCIH